MRLSAAHYLPLSSQDDPEAPLSIFVTNNDVSLFKSLSDPTRRANATLLILVSPRGNVLANELMPTLSNIEDSFNNRLGYPIQLLIDGELPSQEVMEETRRLSGGKATWSLITPEQGWGAPPWIPRETIEDSLARIGFAEGYRSMCRFYSGYFWKHPAVAKYDWVWRLDAGVRFHCDLDYDPFLVMEGLNKTFGYSIAQKDQDYVNKGLWKTVKKFFQEHKEYVAADRDLRFISDDRGGTWNRNIIYNNFEISHRSVSQAW
ncbi:hypothetical protein RQP46_005424 [Phenoliferia psychrophenolica]